MPGIEFVGADTDDQPGDDVLDTGPRRPWPRWVWLVAGVLAVVVAVGVLVSSRPDQAPRATPSAATSGTTPVDATPDPQITALTSDGTSLYWLAGARLYRAGPVGRASISAAVDAVADDFAETQLVADPDERTVWVVSRGSADTAGGVGTVEGFTTGLTRVVQNSAPALINGAAVLNGALYVLSDGTLLRTTAHEHGFEAVATVDRHAADLVATSQGLLFTEGGNASAVGQWTPGGGVHPPIVLDVTGSTLAAVGDTVFVAGTRSGRDVLSTLNLLGPHPARQVVPTGLGGQLQLVATGPRAVIVLGTGRAGLRFACVRGDTPATSAAVGATAPATSANVAILDGVAFEAVGSTVHEADLGTCPG